MNKQMLTFTDKMLGFHKNYRQQHQNHHKLSIVQAFATAETKHTNSNWYFCKP